MHPSAIRRTEILWERRKEIIYTQHKKQEVCGVANFMQILLRNATLTGSNSTLPPSVYRNAEQTTLNITSTDIKNIIRAAAFRLFNLDPKFKPSWTPNVVKPFVSSRRLYHTVRDGFPRNGNKTFTALEFQRLLHVYLRNLAVTSRQHNDAPSYASTILIFCIHAHNATKFEPV